MTGKPMLWIAYNPSISNHTKNREQFNGEKPAWGESLDDFLSKQGIDVPHVDDVLALRMGWVVVESRRLEAPERDEDGNRITDWYWTVIVRKAGF
jgi:hypothetical protein